MKSLDERTFRFGLQFQIDVVTMLVNNIGFLLVGKKYINENYFSFPRLRRFVNHVYVYYDKYKMLPDQTYLRSICENEKDRDYVKRIFKPRVIREEYIRDAVLEFVKRNHFIDLYQKSGKLYNDGSVQKAYDLAYDGLQKLNSIDMYEDKFDFLFSDFEDRLAERQHNIDTLQYFKVRYGIGGVDRSLRGGISNGELGIWLGDAKSGKSFALVHNGVQAVKRFIPVLHIQLEGKRQQVLDRYDASFMGALYDSVQRNEIPDEYVKKMLRIANKRKFRDLIIRTYENWEAPNVLDIERELLSLWSKGYKIKLVIIDYLELMSSRQAFGGAGENADRLRQTAVSRDLKMLAVKYNIAVLTATQSNRYIDNEDPNFLLTSKNIAEDYGKVRVSDIIITINATTEERKHNTARIFVDTVRDNPAKRLIRISQDLDRSRFYVKTSM